MNKDLDHRWVYGQYCAYWEFAFVEDERLNSRYGYEQIIAEKWGGPNG